MCRTIAGRFTAFRTQFHTEHVRDVVAHADYEVLLYNNMVNASTCSLYVLSALLFFFHQEGTEIGNINQEDSYLSLIVRDSRKCNNKPVCVFFFFSEGVIPMSHRSSSENE
mmetsp:Transcript_24298/g.37443  ORF Transcript_24298/g.37443 Transcript_24298/m.37443 type:complete len:111 (-) Transcript_24298:130-462(-)